MRSVRPVPIARARGTHGAEAAERPRPLAELVAWAPAFPLARFAPSRLRADLPKGTGVETSGSSRQTRQRSRSFGYSTLVSCLVSKELAMSRVEMVSDMEVELEPEELLRESDWLLGLARSLLRDPELAEDLTQETMLVALQKKPTDPRKRRPWLAGILRNRWRLHARAGARRRRREEAVATREDRAESESVLEQLEVHGQVVDALLALAEPYRTTLALRFYRDLSHAEIAERFDLEVSSVRARVSRGLELLRAELDRRSDGERKRWVAPLALWLNSMETTAPRVVTSVTAAVFWRWLTGAATIFFAAWGVWWAWSGWDDDEQSGSRVTETAILERPAAEEPPAPKEEAEPPSPSSAPGSLAEALASIEVPELDPSPWPILGRVEDPDGRPRAGVAIEAQPAPRGGVDLSSRIRAATLAERYRRRHSVQTISDAEGRFRLEGLYWSQYVVNGAGDQVHAEPGALVTLRTRETPTNEDRLACPVDVVTHEGKPRDEARLRIVTADAVRTVTWQRSQPQIELPRPPFEITAILANTPISAPLRVAEVPTDVLTIELVPLCNISVVAPMVDPKALERLSVVMTRVPPGFTLPADAPLLTGLHHSLEPSLDAPPLEVLPGRYWARLADDSTTWQSRAIDVTRTHEVLEFDLTEPVPHCLRITVRGLSPEELEDGRFSYSITSPTRSSSGSTGHLPLSDGRFLVRLPEDRLDWLDEAESTLSLEIVAGPRSQRQEVPRGSTEVEFDFGKGVAVTVDCARTIADEVRERCFLALRPKVLEGPKRVVRAVVPRRGPQLSQRVDLGKHEPGTYELLLVSEVRMSPSIVIWKQTVEVGPDPTTLSLTLPSLHLVHFEVDRNQRGSRHLRLTGEAIDSAPLFLRDELVVVLPAGRYTLRSRPSEPSIEFSVPTSLPIRIGE